MTRNATDPREAARARAVARVAKHRKEEDLRYILKDERGRRWLYGLMDWCGFTKAITPGTADTEARLGMRRVALEIISRTDEVSPGVWLQMAREWSNTAEADVQEVREYATGGTHAETVEPPDDDA